MMAIIHSLKCTVPFSFAVPLLSLAVIIAIRCHSLSLVVPLLSLVVIRCHSLYHSLSFVVTRHSLPFVVTDVIHCHSLYHSLSHVVFRCHSLYHLLSLVVIRYHSLSLDVPLVCLFINDRFSPKKF